MSKLNYLLDLIFPPRCVFCGEIMEPSEKAECFCPLCRQKWEQEKSALCPKCKRPANDCTCMPVYNKNRVCDRYFSLVLYDSEFVKRIIHSVKTQNNKALFEYITYELVMKIISKIKLEDKEEYVLSYPQRSLKSRRKYGYDHAEQLCNSVAKYLNLPLFDGIRHKRNNTEQKSLNKASRGENAAKSYYIDEKKKAELCGKNVIFIDDVVTTGATTAVCAALCKSAGAKVFITVSIAKTP